MSMGGALRGIGGVLAAIDGVAFDGLAGVGQFFDALLVGLPQMRQPLGTACLSRTARTYLRGIIAQFVGLRLISRSSSGSRSRESHRFSIGMHDWPADF